MGKNNSVYEELLSNFLAIRKDIAEKTRKAKAEVDESSKNLAVLKDEMHEALSNGDRAKYSEAAREYELNKEFYDYNSNILSEMNTKTLIDPEAAKEVIGKADAEIEKIAAQYNDEMLKLIAPIIELSNKTYAQIELLNLAKDNYRKKLLKETPCLMRGAYDNVPLMSIINYLVQSRPYREIDPDYAINKVPRSGEYNWHKAAIEKIEKERVKWS